jgi:hypothetical protein
MSSSKKLTWKGLCGRCLSEFIDWRYSQSCWYFRPSFVNYSPSNIFSGSPLPPHPSLCQSTVNTGSVWLGRVGGCWVLLQETIFCRSLTLCIWPDSELEKLLDHPKQKPRRGGCLRQINTCRKVTFQVTFLDDDILLWCPYKLISPCL